jgi:hypothetical protein
MSNLPGTSDPLNDRIDSLVENRRRAKEEAALKYGGGFGGRILYGMAESVFGERVASKINTASRDRSQTQKAYSELYNPSEQMTRGKGGSAVREIKPILEKINNKVDYLASKIEKIDARLSAKNITIGKGDKQQTFRYDPLAPEGKQVTAATASGKSGRFASKAESASVLSKAAYLGNQEYQMPQTSTRVSQNDAKQIIEQLKKDLTKSGGRETQSQIAAAEDRKDYAAGEKDERNQEYQEDVIKKLDEILEKIEDGGGALEALLGGAAGAAGAAGLARLLPMLAPLLMNPYVLGAIGIAGVLFAGYKGIEKALEDGKIDKKQTTESGRTEEGKEKSVDVVEAGSQYVPQMPMPGMPVGVGFGGTNVPDKFELPKDEKTVVETYYDGDELIGYLSTDGKLYVAQGKKEEVLERYRKGDATSVTVASGKMPDIPRQETTGAPSPSSDSSELPEGSMPIRNANNEVVGYRKEGGGYEALPGREKELEELSKGANQLNREMRESIGKSTSATAPAPTSKPAAEIDPRFESMRRDSARSAAATEKTIQMAEELADKMGIPNDGKLEIEAGGFPSQRYIKSINGQTVPLELYTPEQLEYKKSDDRYNAQKAAAEQGRPIPQTQPTGSTGESEEQIEFFAKGGPVEEGKKIVVGEEGPEAFFDSKEIENYSDYQNADTKGKLAMVRDLISSDIERAASIAGVSLYEGGWTEKGDDPLLYGLRSSKGDSTGGFYDLFKNNPDFTEKLNELKETGASIEEIRNEYIAMKLATPAARRRLIRSYGSMKAGDDYTWSNEWYEDSGTKPRAKGGPVEDGSDYLVGEQGPELMIPKEDGFIIPAKETKMLLNGTRARGGRVENSLKYLVGEEGPELNIPNFGDTLREVQNQLEMSEEENRTALETASPVINNIDSRTINNVAPSSAPPPPMTVNSRNDETSYADIAARIFSHPAKHPIA